MNQPAVSLAAPMRLQPTGDLLTFPNVREWALPCLCRCARFLRTAPAEKAIGDLFRSAELRVAAQRVFPESCHTAYDRDLQVRFGEFHELQRAAAADGVLTSEEVAEELRRPGAILVSDWSSSLFDGALTPETAGFIDDDAMPPWDTWIALVQVEGSHGAACLLSWVPRWLFDRVNFAVQVDAAECLSWACFDPQDRLIPKGWGRVWQSA